jgi:hypothetical protein
VCLVHHSSTLSGLERLRTVGLLVGRIPLLGVELQTVGAHVYIPLYIHGVGGLQRDVVY